MRPGKWKCPNTRCVQHGVVIPLPSGFFASYDCPTCGTALVIGGRR